MVRIGQPRYGGSFDASDGGVLPFVMPGEGIEGGEILEPSAGRIAPKCIHFGVCGGCQYQHATYDAQKDWKLEILDALARQAGLHPWPQPGLHAGEPCAYRNRVRMRLAQVDGVFRPGYSRRGTNDFLPVVMCPIAAPLLVRAAEAVAALANVDAGWMAAVTEFELFTTPDQARLQMQFLLSEAGTAQRAKGSFNMLCERLRAQLPELVGAGAALDPELGRRARRAWDGATWGASGMAYAVAGRDYWVSRGAFFQVNRLLVERLVELVCSGAAGHLAWDLFAGVGLFTRVLAERFDRVVAVEGGEVAARDLAAASRGNRVFTARRMATLDFLREQEFQRERPDLVVLDPPRAGLGAEAAGVLARIGPARVVYVSCDPTTLMPDLAVFLRAGYVAERVDLIDLFPQTFHMETVVVLRRG